MLDRIISGRTDLVVDYISAGNEATASDSSGVSLIAWCAYYGDVSAIRHLVEHGESLDRLGTNLDLNGAAFHGHWRLCEYLLEHGAAPNHPLPDTGETPLHAALCKPNRPAYDAVVEVLITSGADPNAATIAGVVTGCFMRDARTRGETPLHRAAAYGSAETIDRLIAAGAKLDVRDANGDTPLAWASWHLRPDAILKRLCYGDIHIHHGRDSKFDHGAGWGVLDSALLGSPKRSEK